MNGLKRAGDVTGLFCINFYKYLIEKSCNKIFIFFSRWAQNVAGLELMLSEEELFEVADFDAVFSLILEKN